MFVVSVRNVYKTNSATPSDQLIHNIKLLLLLPIGGDFDNFEMKWEAPRNNGGSKVLSYELQVHCPFCHTLVIFWQICPKIVI